ncbi:MAG: AraC family transcriptional regulator [Flavitalea sp.]
MKPILRKIDTGHNNYSFSVREDVFPYLYNHWHYHPEVELTLIRKGSGIRLVGDSIEQFESGDLALLGSNLPHLWRSDAIYFEQVPGLNVEAVAIHFKDDFWGRDFIELPEIKPVRELLEKAKNGLRITGVSLKKITGQMEAMLKATGAIRVALLLEMLHEIASSKEYVQLSSAGFAKSYDVANTDKVSLIYTYTFNNFQNKISIIEAAAKANISPHSFCRYFKSRTLKTYGQFVLEVRIGYACKLLIENKMSIATIAYACGFNNLSNFNRQFKTFVKKTPIQYLREYTKSA